MGTKTSLLKRGLFLLFLLTTLQQFSKAQAVTADPALGSLDITNTDNSPANANVLNNATKYLLKLQVLNLHWNPIPATSAIIKINLGTNMILDPTYDLSTAPLVANFTWSYDNSGSTPQIIGIIHTPIPAYYFETAVFRVMPTNPGSSISTANFLVDNTILLSDANPGNNNAFIFYTVVAQGPLPVTLTRFSAVKTDCNINVNWSVENEINFDRYELEVSKDGVNFNTVSTISANNSADYNFSFSITGSLQANVLQVRLKMIDKDGAFKYSNIVTVGGTCNGKFQPSFYGYPNPVTRGMQAMTIAKRDGNFNGTYKLILSDMSGKNYSVKVMMLNNVSLFQFDVSQVLATGKYVIQILKTDGTENGVIQFQKL